VRVTHRVRSTSQHDSQEHQSQDQQRLNGFGATDSTPFPPSLIEQDRYESERAPEGER